MPKFNQNTINKMIRTPIDMHIIITKDANNIYQTFSEYTRKALIAYYDERNGEYSFEREREKLNKLTRT